MVNNANSDGFKVEYPENSPDAVLQAFNGEDVTIKLPNGLKSNEIGTYTNQLRTQFGKYVYIGTRYLPYVCKYFLFT